MRKIAAISAGGAMVAAGVAGIWYEIGREQFRIGDAVIGGPDRQAIFAFAVIIAVGVGVVGLNFIQAARTPR